jgi:hypothetical protein
MMADKEKHPLAGAPALGDNPFAGMDTLEWLGVESPPTPELESAAPPKIDNGPTLNLPDDEAERALLEWLRAETPPTETPPTADAQAQLLARLLAEQEEE